MALESVNAAETLIQSGTDNDDLEDGEIPSDEDDEPVPQQTPPKPPVEPPKTVSNAESPKDKSSETKFSKSKKPSGNSRAANVGQQQDRFGKYKNPSEDWAGDVEKAIRAVLDEQDRYKGHETNKSKSRTNRNKNRKRARDEKEEERSKDQKKRKLSDEENGNEDDDEMLFVRGASPVLRRDDHDTTRSPSRRSIERDSYDNLSESDERPSDRRQRDNDNNKRGSSSSGAGGRASAGRRGGKTERGGKNKGRAQLRNERNGRRSQNPDHGQDPDAICLYYMQGKCHRGDDCPFSHNALPPRKMELCKFYLMDCCAKRDKCLYMHHDFPCKFFHTGLKCVNGENCKFSHQPLNEQVKNILLKHLETAPKEILGDFPRLSREGALLMINNTARNSAQGQDNTGNQKIPSLFDVALPTPVNTAEQEDEESRGNNIAATLNKDQSLAMALQQKRSSASSAKERKPTGKKTRWGSDEDRVPYEQIMLLQSVSQLGLHLPNVALGLAVQQQLQQHILIQQCIANMEFYNEIHGSPPEASANKEKDKNKQNEDFTKDVGEEDIIGQQARVRAEILNTATSKDIDLREILNANRSSAVVSIADEAASLTTSKLDDESDRDEDANLVIEMPTDDDDRNKHEDKEKGTTKKKEERKGTTTEDNVVEQAKSHTSGVPEDGTTLSCKSPTSSLSSPHPQNTMEDQETLPNIPKRAQELFMRIQQQQRAAKDSLAIADEKGRVEDVKKNRDNWYYKDNERVENVGDDDKRAGKANDARCEDQDDDDEDNNDDDNDDDDDDDDDDDEVGNLTIVIKDSQKEDGERGGEEGSGETLEDDKEEKMMESSGVPQPAVFADTLGNLSKIDISAEVTKLLSAIKPQSSKSHHNTRQEASQSKIDSRTENKTKLNNDSTSELSKNSQLVSENSKNTSEPEKMLSRGGGDNNSWKIDNEDWSSGVSSRVTSTAAPISRDPRMSRDPRQRRDEQKSASPTRTGDTKKESRSLRPEASIYSSGITAVESTMDTDLRARLDQDHRRKDMDLRQRFQQDFGDTDLRVAGSNFPDASNWRSDVDLRQMLSLPFKPAPSHVPCTEIAASISSHPPITYKVYVVDIPRPDYTGLKLTKNDAQVKYDPRLRKIFRLPKVEVADSPMSPPPTHTGVKPEAPKSPPHTTVRSDPRRKPPEASNQISQNSTMPIVAVNPGGGGMLQGQGGGIGGGGGGGGPHQIQQQPDGMTGMGMNVQGLCPPVMAGMPPMGQNPMMGPMMGGPIPPPNMPPMGMGPGPPPGMGPGNGPPIQPNQMGYDPRYAAQRNGGPGLLGPAPVMGYGPPDLGPPGYDGPPGYPGNANYGNFGLGPAPVDSGIMGFGPGGANTGNFGGNPQSAEWNPANQNQARRGGGGGGGGAGGNGGNRMRRRNRNRTNAGANNRGNRSPP